jgi:hypothetical protein
VVRAAQKKNARSYYKIMEAKRTGGCNSNGRAEALSSKP